MVDPKHAEAARFYQRIAIVGAALTMLAFLFGMAGQIYSMYTAFEMIEEMTAPTPGELSRHVHASMRIWVWCGVIAALGAILLLTGLVLRQRVERERAAAADADLLAR